MLCSRYEREVATAKFRAIDQRPSISAHAILVPCGLLDDDHYVVVDHDASAGHKGQRH
jgi:hypothetical protein